MVTPGRGQISPTGRANVNANGRQPVNGFSGEVCCCVSTPLVYYQARDCVTDALIDLYAHDADVINVVDDDDPGTVFHNVQLGTGVAALPFYFKDEWGCYYIQASDAVDPDIIPITARWLMMFYWPWILDMAGTDPASSSPYRALYAKINSSCELTYHDDWNVCDRDGDGDPDPYDPPASSDPIPDDCGCTDPPLYTWILVRFFGNDCGCVSGTHFETDLETANGNDEILCEYNATVSGNTSCTALGCCWAGRKPIRYRECFTGVDPCDTCDAWSYGFLEVIVIWVDPVAGGGFGGWRVKADVYNSLGSLAFHYFDNLSTSETQPDAGDCSGATGLVNDATVCGPTQWGAGGTADVYNASPETDL